jgi:hypothetical protein
MGTSTETGIQKIPKKYHDFKDVFEKKNANILLEYCPYDCAIELQDGAQPPFGPIYNLLQTELATLREYIDKTSPRILFGIQNHLLEHIFCL